MKADFGKLLSLVPGNQDVLSSVTSPEPRFAMGTEEDKTAGVLPLSNLLFLMPST